MARVFLLIILGLIGVMTVRRVASGAGRPSSGEQVEARPDAQTGVTGDTSPLAIPPQPLASGRPEADSASATPLPRSLDLPDSAGSEPGVAFEAPSRTPSIDRLARLESRRRLFQSARHTFIDSLFQTPDSVVRRWPVQRRPLAVFLTVPDSLASHRGRAHRAVDLAMGRWNEVALGVRYQRVSDSSDADIVVRWIPQFSSDRSGQAELTFDAQGVIRHVTVTLAVRDAKGIPLNDAELGIVATHEFGHALGLPHSTLATDIMFPTSSVNAISRRDRATAVLLYSLVPGPLREPAA